MGDELEATRGGALRRSVELSPSPNHLKAAEFQFPHRRGEILVAAMLRAFIEIWSYRIHGVGDPASKVVPRDRVVEERYEIANRLLTIAIRALDYAPPVDLQFEDYLSALLTADRELYPDDWKYNIRGNVTASFAEYGILPVKTEAGGIWERAPESLRYDRTRFESLQRDPDEVFRFIWENRTALHRYPGAFSRVLSVRPCVRTGSDGFFLRKTVAEYVEILKLRASELGVLRLIDKRNKINVPLERPKGMADDEQVSLYGGGALIFDEFGRLKFNIKNRIDSPRQHVDERLRPRKSEQPGRAA